jgi:hypothetical protein
MEPSVCGIDSRQLLFCQVGVSKEFTPSTVKSVWRLNRSAPPGDQNVHKFVRDLCCLDSEEVKASGRNIGVICMVNGKKIGENAIFSDFPIVESTSLSERTCVVCLFNREFPRFEERFLSLFADIDVFLEHFLRGALIDGLKNMYESACKSAEAFIKSVLGEEAIDTIFRNTPKSSKAMRREDAYDIDFF